MRERPFFVAFFILRYIMIIKCFIYGVLSIIEKSPPLDLQGRAFFVSGVVFGFHQPFYGFGLLGIRLKAFPICLFGLFNVLGQKIVPLCDGAVSRFRTVSGRMSA